MDPSYAMAKFGLESKDILKSKQKGCWHYMKYFFFFSSIIQFLIILGLVLFMLYGNAHVGTELRLKSVENRYKNLTNDHALLKSNFTVLKEKLASAEKYIKNCSDTVTRMRAFVSLNRTSVCPRTLPILPNCINLQTSYDQLNMSCFADRLREENFKMRITYEFNTFKANWTKMINEHANKERTMNFENSELQKDKKALALQIRLLQDSCTKIDEKFRLELQNLKNYFDTSLKTDTLDSYSASVRCKPLTENFINRIDATLARMRDDVTNFMYENTQMRAANARINEDLGKCNQEKDIVTANRNNLAAEKTSLEKQMGEKKDELNRCYSQSLRKQEELDSCRRMQRPPMFPSLQG